MEQKIIYDIELGKQSLISKDKFDPTSQINNMINIETSWQTRCYICSYGHCRRNCPLIRCANCNLYGHSEKICNQSKFKCLDKFKPCYDEENQVTNSRAVKILFT